MPSKVDSIFRITATQSRFLALKSNTNTATAQPSPSNKNVAHSTAATATTITKAVSSRSRPRLDWTPEVDAQLVDLRMTHNKKWLEIGQQLGREPATCMNRFESTLNPALKGFWTTERDQQLDELIAASKSWADIANVLGVHRLACMARWRQLQPEDGLLPTDQSQLVEGTHQRRAKLVPNQHEQQQQQQRSKEQLRETQAMIQKAISSVDLDMVHSIDKDLDRLSWNTCLKDDQRYSHYRSWKKKARLDAFSQLYLINPGWSAKEETVLIQFVLEHGLDQWHIVAREGLKGRFTAAQCRTCWKNLDMPVVAPLASNVKQQEQQQQQESRRYEDKLESSSGLASSPFSPSISKKECDSGKSSLLIKTVPSSNEKENAWTREQQIQFWHLWSQHGQDWETIANAMDISMSSCKNYYANTTRRFHKDDNGDKDDNKDHPEVQERIWTLARTITQDFKPIASHSPASDDNDKNESNIDIKTAHSGVTPSQEIPAKPSRAPPFIWDKELSVRLQAVVRQAYKSQVVHLDEINWLLVSRRVHPNATSRICKNHWKFLHDAVGGTVVWSQEDIRRLEEGVRLLGPKRLTAIREHFLPHMTKDDITRQWFRISDKATIIDEEEYYKLLSAVKDVMDSSSARRVDLTSTSITDIPHYNTSSVVVNLNESELQELEDPQSHHWTEVEKRMGAGWKRLPCKRVWESSFQYLIRHTQWTNDEDTTLLRLVKFVGRDDWHSVAKAMQSGKSAWQCRLRWCQLLDPVDLDSNELMVSGEKYC